MGLAYTPVVKISGAHASLFNERLLSWEIIDAPGRQTDQLTLQVDTQGIEGLPKEGETLGIEVGYQEESTLIDKGQFQITRVTRRLFPSQITVIATAAPFKVNDETEFKKRRSASYEKTTLGGIFRQLVSRHGFSPRIAPELDQINIEHEDQSEETDMSFLTRLAKRYDAVCKPIDDLYVLAQRGQVKSISGQTIPSIRVDLPKSNQPSAQGFINAEAEQSSRIIFKGVVANYWNAEAGKETEIKIGEQPFKKLSKLFETQAQASEVAEAELLKLRRIGMRIKLDVPGDAQLCAEGIIILGDGFPEFMRGKWSMDRVILRGDRTSAFRASIEASQPL